MELSILDISGTASYASALDIPLNKKEKFKKILPHFSEAVASSCSAKQLPFVS